MTTQIDINASFLIQHEELKEIYQATEDKLVILQAATKELAKENRELRQHIQQMQRDGILMTSHR